MDARLNSGAPSLLPETVTNEVVASWMTREDREVAIGDNIDYVNAALESVPDDPRAKVVYAGFSQGVAMAFRSAVRGKRAAAGIIGVGGDVPPELLLDPHVTFPSVFLARGIGDEWLAAERFRADVNALAARSGRVRAHELVVICGARRFLLHAGAAR